MIRFAITTVAVALIYLPAQAQLGILKPKPTPAPAAPTNTNPASAPIPWANKFFIPGMLENPNLPVPATINHDFGTVPYGTLCTKKFTVTNIYAVPIQVIDIRVECGCLKAYPPQKVLQPNESAEFVVTMNTAVFKGKSSKLMRVTFGPNFVNTAELRFDANSRADVVISEPGQIDFLTVAQGTKTTKEVTVGYHGSMRNWKVEGVVQPKNHVLVEVRERGNSPRGGIEYLVTAKLKEDAAAGEINESITLKTNDPSAPLISVNVRGSVLAPITAVPGKIDFKEVAVGQTVKQNVMIRATTACSVQPVAEDADGVSVEVFNTSSQLHYVTVIYTPKKAGPIRKEIQVKSNLPGTPTAIIVIEATAK